MRCWLKVQPERPMFGSSARENRSKQQKQTAVSADQAGVYRHRIAYHRLKVSYRAWRGLHAVGLAAFDFAHEPSFVSHHSVLCAGPLDGWLHAHRKSQGAAESFSAIDCARIAGAGCTTVEGFGA